jgi:hypothetical protein
MGRVFSVDVVGSQIPKAPAKAFQGFGSAQKKRAGLAAFPLFSCLLFVRAVGRAKDRQAEQVRNPDALVFGCRLELPVLLRADAETGYDGSAVRLFRPRHCVWR